MHAVKNDTQVYYYVNPQFRTPLSSILMLFYYLAPLQNDSIMTSRCVQFTFHDKEEVYQLDESSLPVNEKESRQEGKRSISILL